ERAGRDRDTAEAVIAGADAERQAASEARAEADTALSSTRAALAALDSEAAALRRAVESGAGGKSRALDRLKAAPGYEHALAAALGDDLEAPIGADGPRFWGGAEPADGDPALPAECAALSGHVTAPPELARRL